MSEGRRRVTGSRRQARRRGASVTVAVPPMRCIRAGPLVRGRLGVLGGRSGSTCDASVLAIDPCSQCRRRGWMWRYPLVKTRPGPQPRATSRRRPDRGVPPSNLVGNGARGVDASLGLRCDPTGSPLSLPEVVRDRRGAAAAGRWRLTEHRACVAGVVYATTPSGSRSVGEWCRLCRLPGRFTMMCGGAATSAAGVQMLCLPLASGAVTRIGRAPGFSGARERLLT